MLLLAVLWFVEIFAVQGVTLGYDYTAVWWRGAVSHVWRLGLDALAVGTLVTWLSPAALAVAMGLWVVFAKAVLVYHSFFGRALGWSSLVGQAREGLVGISGDTTAILDAHTALLVLLFAVKIGLLWRAGRGLQSARTAAALGGGYLCLAAVGATAVDPLHKLRRYASVDRLGATHGYLITWAGEALYLDAEALLAEQKELATIIDTTVTARLQSLPVGRPKHVVILQLESVDWRVLGARVDGEPVVPFMKELMASSVVIKTAAVHRNGTADTDFVMLAGYLPSRSVVAYKLRGLDYGGSLARKAIAGGYEPWFIHGNDGAFFNRRAGVEQMGFGRILFQEELRERGLRDGTWGINDDDVLRFLASELRSAKHPVLLYWISLTTHFPFSFLPPAAAVNTEGNAKIQDRYFVSMAWLDRSLRDFVGALPPGTLVVLLGDHRAAVDHSPAEVAFHATGETVPTIIHVTGDDLSALQGRVPLDSVHSALSVSHFLHATVLGAHRGTGVDQ